MLSIKDMEKLEEAARTFDPNIQTVTEVGRAGDGVAGATKLDYGKAPIFKLFLKYFPLAIGAVSNVSEYGLRKYNPDGDGTGWRDVPDGINRYGDGLARHLIKEASEGPYDNLDSGLSHAAQVAWNAMARLELLLRAGQIEDRRGNILKEGRPVLGTARKA